MEGSPALGKEMDGFGPLLFGLNGARTMADLRTRLVSGLSALLQYGSALVILRNSSSSDLDFSNLTVNDSISISPSWLKSHLDRHPELSRKLNRGEMVGITHVEGSTTPQPASGVRHNLLLLPILPMPDVLAGVIGFVVPVEELQHSEDEVELVRGVSQFVGPIVARLEELESLRSDRRNYAALQAILEMQTHMQSNVAHELRTPLATVRGYTRMILDGRAGEIPQTQRNYLNIVTDSANRLINLVNWMSYVLQYGVQHMKLGAANLKELWTACVKVHQVVLTEKSITLQQQVSGDAFLTTCDHAKMEYAFSSLLANAIAHTPTGGRINVEFSRGRHGEFTFKITDFGEGLPPEQLNKIFERHYASSFSALNPSDFGLAGVYDIIGMHGGRLFVNSRTGEGSTFLFTLPAVRQDSEEKLG